eukprot:EC689288.1.p2 GENE.EC689288.1~~EC689288.1.p2  ORF type:complete len:71 (-),score=8.78 EC689288.1:60-272(-)
MPLVLCSCWYLLPVRPPVALTCLPCSSFPPFFSIYLAPFSLLARSLSLSLCWGVFSPPPSRGLVSLTPPR